MTQRPLRMFKNFLQKELFHGKVICRSSSSEEVISAMSALKPIDNGHELIRIGGEGDGGYLLPDDLHGIAACFSPGVGNSSTFERDLIERWGIPCFLADFSVDNPVNSGNDVHFEKKYIGSVDDGNFILLDDWMENNIGNHDAGDLILQMDIEGWEYDSIINISDINLQKFRIITVEFHQIDKIFLKPLVSLYASIFRKITRFHDVIHIHPNNSGGQKSSGGLDVPRLLEVTLHRKDRAKYRAPRTNFPHALDHENAAADEVPLPKWIYK